MTVYILSYSYESYHGGEVETNHDILVETNHDILGVYATRELAQDARSQAKRFGCYIQGFEVEDA
jgi:hypothetical protein